jgi:HEAT repeat protein
MSNENTYARLSDSDLSDSDLAELSGLNTEQLAQFEQTYGATETEQRRRIVGHLVKLADENIELNFNTIFKNRLTDPDAEVRRQAIEGLWECEEPSMVPLLIDLLENDSSEMVQAEAAAALGRFAILAEHGKLNENTTINLGLALLSTIDDINKTVDIRCRALEAVAPLSLPGVNSVINVSYHADDDQLNLSAICAMGTSCDPSWLPTLLSELTNSDAERRRVAAAALGELEEEEDTVPQLAELVYDDDTDVQLTAIQALGEIGGAEARECLELCMDDEEEAIRLAAEEALGKASDKEDQQSFSI